VDPRQTGELIGKLLIPVLGAVACLWVGVRATSARPRSRRLAGLGLAFGLAVLPLAGLATFARGPEGRAFLIGTAVATAVAGVIALWLGAAAGSARNHEDEPERGSSGTAALVMGALGLLVGVGLAMMPFLANPPATTPPWSYKIEPPGVELTLPSDRWKKYDRQGDVAFFACQHPQMVAGVKEVRPANSPEEFESAVGVLKRVVARTPAQALDEKRGPNAHGHEHWLYVAEENTPYSSPCP
jgi:hypothetical protein